MIDANSRTWLTIVNEVNGQLAVARTRLEGGLSWDETVACRAQIRTLKHILDLPKVEVPAVDQDFELPQ